MKLHRTHVVAGYLVAVILLLFPLMEVALAVWPLRPGSVAWRYGSVGIFSRALMTPLLGLLLATALALLLKQARILSALAVASGLVGFLLLFTTGRFLLDALQMGAQVGADPVAQSTLQATTYPAIIKLSLTAGAMILFAAGNWYARAPHSQARSAFGAHSRARPAHVDAV